MIYLQRLLTFLTGTKLGSTTGMWVEKSTGKAYLRHNHHETQQLVEELNDDWTNGTSNYAVVFDMKGHENTFPLMEGGEFELSWRNF